MRNYVTLLKSLMSLLIRSSRSLKNMYENRFQECGIMVAGIQNWITQAEFIDMGPLSRDSWLSMEAYSFFFKASEVCMKHLLKAGLLKKELKMPDIPWLSFDEGTLRLGEFAMLERVLCIKHNPPQWEGPENVPVTNPIKCQMVRGLPAHLKSFVVSLFLVPNLRVRDAVAQLDKLTARGLAGP